MTHFICETCGTQYGSTAQAPAQCSICKDERQFVGHQGQRWTSLDELNRTHRNSIRQEEANLVGIGVEPRFAIGQRALLIRSSSGNVLWDCVPRVDQALIDMIHGLGGLSSIAISHPHYYSSMIEFSHAFDCPIFLHESDRQWVMRPDPSIIYWQGDTFELNEHIDLIRCGGHFDGGTVLHWKNGTDEKGTLLTGDIIQVVEDRNWVSFMYSYPNLIPLSASAVARVVLAVASLEFDRIYGAWWDKVIPTNAKAIVLRSAQRFINAVNEK